MIVILEGPDGSGKSTLAESVYRKTQATGYRHGPPPRGKAMATFMNTCASVANNPAPCVVDRLHWGAWPYGIVYRGGSELELSDIHRLDKFLTDAGAVIVLVTAHPDTLVERVASRGEELSEFEQPENVARICELYDEVFAGAAQRFPDSILRVENDEFIDGTDDRIIELARQRYSDVRYGHSR